MKINKTSKFSTGPMGYALKGVYSSIFSSPLPTGWSADTLVEDKIVTLDHKMEVTC